MNLTGLGDANFSSADPLKTTKFYPPRNFPYGQTGTIVDATTYFGPMRKAGLLQAFDAMITEVIATGGDRTVTLALAKSTGGGAFVAAHAGTFQFTSSSTLLTVTAGTFSDATFIAGDVFRLTVTVAGAALAQAQGLAVHVSAYEAP